jgi:hypothetical protein
MEVISHIAVDYFRDMMERDRYRPRFSASIERINVAPLRLPLDLMSDREAAREIATAIYRALSREVRA